MSKNVPTVSMTASSCGIEVTYPKPTKDELKKLKEYEKHEKERNKKLGARSK